jgi:Arc/MetJ-type ribon-helix-helix transcriptional regulator
MPMVSLRLTETEAAVLDELTRRAHAKSRSDCLRAAMFQMAHQFRLKAGVSTKIREERSRHRPRRHQRPDNEEE